MYDATGRHGNLNQTSKNRRFLQRQLSDKALVDIPTNILPNHYSPAGQENAHPVKSSKKPTQTVLGQIASIKKSVPILGNADNNGIKKTLQQTKPPESQKLTSESKYIVPENIYDKRSGETYKKLRYLGEGGFAICYEVENSRQQKYALKVVAKKSLREQKIKTKFLAEINIHRSLKHPGIVRFYSCFEDSQNAYLVLEVCENHTLARMLKQRERLSEPETRYYLIQLLDICRFMHDNKVIHRDIKANNILLDYKMDAKLGDFGLAALLVNAEERKRTICGTPNYMAPEILYGRNGHNQQADIWSLGILCYTMLVGTPPFHESSHDAIYQKIRNNQIMQAYTFPDNVKISDNAKDVITSLLVNDPDKRPTIKQLLEFPFFHQDYLPAAIPVCALERAPTELDYSRNKATSKSVTSPDNAAAALRRAKQQNDIYAHKSQTPLENLELLSVQAFEYQSDEFSNSDKSRKNVSPVQSKSSQESITSQHSFPKRPVSSRAASNTRVRESKSNRQETDNLLSRLRQVTPPLAPQPLKNKLNTSDLDVKVPLDDPLDHVIQCIYEALDTLLSSKQPIRSAARSRRKEDEEKVLSSVVFIDRWVDFTTKYGIGYCLSDGSDGIYFNDATTLINQSNSKSVSYVIHSQEAASQPQTFATDNYPDYLRKKMNLLPYFQNYMYEKLASIANDLPAGLKRTSRQTTFLESYMETERALVFRLSNNVLQINFLDHTKLVLFDNAASLIYVNAARKWSVHSLVMRDLNQDIISRLEFAREVLKPENRARLINQNC
ncbi:kinase-like domain-containing protein [Umbelopsis sp. PMI_123]|nr:kinase-like domain-containing protein [Umbelopsis sp. PMI_123]